MLELIYKRIKQTPLENALTTYNFIRNDLSEGLNYGMGIDNYNKCMKAIGSALRIKARTTAEKFCKDFYAEYVNLQSGTLNNNKEDEDDLS